MAYALRSPNGTGTAGNASGSGLSLTKPSGVVDGDLLVVTAYLESDTNTWTAPSGWNADTTNLKIVNTGIFHIQTFWKIASSEPSSWTWTPASSGWRALSIAAFTGASGTGERRDVSGSSQGDSQASTAQTAPTITPTANDALVTFNYGNYAGNNPGSIAGYGETIAATLGGCVVAYKVQTTATATGTSWPTGGSVGTEDYAATHVGWFLSTGGTSDSVLSASGTGAFSGVGASQADSVLSSAGVGAFTGVGASLADSVLNASGVGALTGIGSSLADSVLSGAAIATFGGVGASVADSVLGGAGVGAASFASDSLTAFNPVLVSRRFRRKHVRTPLDFKVKRHRAASYPSDRIENTTLTVAATSSASFVGAEGGTTFKVELVSRRFGRRKTRISEADVLFSFQREARKWEPIYGTISIPAPMTSRRQWRKRKRVDSTPFLSRKAPRARSLLTTEPSSEYAVLSASGAGDASFVGASLFDAILSVAGTSEATFPTTVIASAALTAAGVGAAVFISDDAALAANLNQAFFGRRRMVRQ